MEGGFNICSLSFCTVEGVVEHGDAAEAEGLGEGVFDFVGVGGEGVEDVFFSVGWHDGKGDFGVATVLGDFGGNNRHKDAFGKFDLFGEDFCKGFTEVFKPGFHAERHIG